MKKCFISKVSKIQTLHIVKLVSSSVSKIIFTSRHASLLLFYISSFCWNGWTVSWIRLILDKGNNNNSKHGKHAYWQRYKSAPPAFADSDCLFVTHCIYDSVKWATADWEKSFVTRLTCCKSVKNFTRPTFRIADIQSPLAVCKSCNYHRMLLYLNI